MDGIVGDEDGTVEVKLKEISPKTELHRNNIFYVRDIAEFENMSPDIMTIKYLDKDNAEHTLYYNYKTKTYNEEGETYEKEGKTSALVEDDSRSEPTVNTTLTNQTEIAPMSAAPETLDAFNGLIEAAKTTYYDISTTAYDQYVSLAEEAEGIYSQNPNSDTFSAYNRTLDDAHTDYNRICEDSYTEYGRVADDLHTYIEDFIEQQYDDEIIDYREYSDLQKDIYRFYLDSQAEIYRDYSDNYAEEISRMYSDAYSAAYNAL
jgi:hypothetical protein